MRLLFIFRQDFKVLPYQKSIFDYCGLSMSNSYEPTVKYYK